MTAVIIQDAQNVRSYHRHLSKIKFSVLLADQPVNVFQIYLRVFFHHFINEKRGKSESPRIPPPICGACAYPQRLNPGEVRKSFQRSCTLNDYTNYIRVTSSVQCIRTRTDCVIPETRCAHPSVRKQAHEECLMLKEWFLIKYELLLEHNFINDYEHMGRLHDS